LVIERKTILFFFTLEDESLIVKIFLNKQEVHNIEEGVMEMALGTLKKRYNFSTLSVFFYLCTIWTRHSLYFLHPTRRILGVGF
jgi:hypothetical protein